MMIMNRGIMGCPIFKQSRLLMEFMGPRGISWVWAMATLTLSLCGGDPLNVAARIIHVRINVRPKLLRFLVVDSDANVVGQYDNIILC